MRSFLLTFSRAILLTFRRCSTVSQAVACNMLLAFFPMLLLVLALLNLTTGPLTAQPEVIRWIRLTLPPGSSQVVVDFLSRPDPHPWRWALLGLSGFLLAGTQALHLLMDGFRQITGTHERPPFWSRQFRALFLLLLTIVPWLATVVLTVFGNQARAWVGARYGLIWSIRVLWGGLLLTLILVMAMLVIAVLYRASQRGFGSWRGVLPGAAVATLLWWAANSAFGVYVRRVPYSLAYGGLAAAIGLLIWMQLTTVVVFIGAAFNALRTSSIRA